MWLTTHLGHLMMKIKTDMASSICTFSLIASIDNIVASHSMSTYKIYRSEKIIWNESFIKKMKRYPGMSSRLLSNSGWNFPCKFQSPYYWHCEWTGINMGQFSPCCQETLDPEDVIAARGFCSFSAPSIYHRYSDHCTIHASDLSPCPVAFAKHIACIHSCCCSSFSACM